MSLSTATGSPSSWNSFSRRKLHVLEPCGKVLGLPLALQDGQGLLRAPGGVTLSHPEDRPLEHRCREVLVRELGLGLNRALTPESVVNDIGTFERMCGVHLSLGQKHSTYPKPGIDRERAKHHVDVFADTTALFLDVECVFTDGSWRVGLPGAAESSP